jgi:hypothetical protein
LALEVALPWLVKRPQGAENYALAAQALGGAKDEHALPDLFAGLMRDCAIAPALPAECAPVSDTALAQAMKSDANYSMSQNAACAIGHDDLDHIAQQVMQLKIA